MSAGRLKKEAIIPTTLFLIAIIGSMLSQTPTAYLGEEGGPVFYLKFLWLLPGLWMIVTRPFDIFNKSLAFFYLFATVFWGYCIICTTFSGEKYIGADVINVTICLAVTVTSYAFWKNYGNKRAYSLLVWSLTISAIFLSLVSYSVAFANISLGETNKADVARNSYAMILLCSICMILPYLLYQKNHTRLFLIGAISLFTIIIFLCRSRATLLGFFFVPVYYSLRYNNSKVKTITFLLSLAFILIILINDQAYDLIVNKIIFRNEQVGDLNKFSSGRIELMDLVIRDIPDNFWFGFGNRYMDCFPLIIIGQYGIFCALWIFGFLFKVGKYSLKAEKIGGMINISFFLIFWIMIINCLFEAQPPFGPGVKCFMLWMLFGFYLAKKKIQV